MPVPESISFIDHQRPPCSATMQPTFEAGDARIAMAQCLRCPKMNWGIYEWTCAIKMLNSAVSNRIILCSRTRRRSNHRRYSALLRIGFRNDRLSRKAGRTIYGDVESAGRSARSWTLCRNGSPQACLTLRATRG